MRGLQNANLAFQITVESFTIPNRINIPPFHWSSKHSFRLRTAHHQFKKGFSRGRFEGQACFQSRRQYHHRPPYNFSHSSSTSQVADERSSATAAEESSSLLKKTHSQSLKSTDASTFPQVDPTSKDVATSSSENQWPNVAIQTHQDPSTSNRFNTEQDEDWFEEPEEENQLPKTRYSQSSRETQLAENTGIEQKPLKLQPRSYWWRRNFGILQTKYFWTNSFNLDTIQLIQTKDPYSIQSIEWRSIWFDHTEVEQSVNNIASAEDHDDGGSSTESILCDPVQIKYELDMRAYEDKMALLDIGDDEKSLTQNLHWLDNDPQAIRTTWELQDPNLSETLWERAMIWLLRYHPEKAVPVLWNTFTEPYPNLRSVLDTIKYLSAFYFMHHPKYTIIKVPTFVDFFLHVLRYLPQNYNAEAPFQRIVHLILTHSNKDLGLTLYSALRQKKIQLHLWTNLHFAYFFAREGLSKLSMEILEEVIVQGLDMTSFPFLSTCNKIIRSTLLHPEGYRSSTHLVSRLMDIGVQFDRILYNVLLANAVEVGDLQTATKIFELVEGSKMGPDNYTWSIILIGCKKCHDPVIVDSILSKASSASLNHWAAIDLMHCLYLHAKRRNTENIYSTVSKVYLKYFDPSPLRELGILLESPSSETTQSLSEPPSAAIGLMLALFLRFYGTERNVMEIYNRFRTGIFNRSSLIQLTLTDYTYNAFLYTASRWPTTLRFCTDILHDMNTPLPNNVLPRHPKTNKILAQAQPTMQTWNIFLQAFVLHKQPAAAEKVLGLMQRRGMKPNSVTWNSIIKAYALVQDVKGLVDATMRREKSGFADDRFTRRALKRIENKKELAKLLKKIARECGKELAVKMTTVTSQQSKSMTTEGTESFGEKRNHNLFKKSYGPYNNDDSTMLNTTYRCSVAQGFELPFSTYPSMA